MFFAINFFAGWRMKVAWYLSCAFIYKHFCSCTYAYTNIQTCKHTKIPNCSETRAESPLKKPKNLFFLKFLIYYKNIQNLLTVLPLVERESNQVYTEVLPWINLFPPQKSFIGKVFLIPPQYFFPIFPTAEISYKEQ